MAANSYYNTHVSAVNEQQQHLLAYASPLSDHFSQPSTPLKPLHLAAQPAYHHANSSVGNHDDLQHALQDDTHLKALIRRFRLISRILSTLISIGVLVPLTMTVIKFLTTQNTYRTVTTPSGTTSRTAWHHDSRTWPTYSYFGVALLSTLLNFATVCSYAVSVSRANAVSVLTSTFSWIDMLGNLVVWAVAASVYRAEKDKGGKNDDLWGWTCSPAARAIQKEFANEVDFNRYCDVQSAGWFVGLAQVGAGLLTVVIYVLVIKRGVSKRRVKRFEGSTGMG
ncbi:hypothetical protein SVAN01_09727 [Stagonosporopsis vannaccii]|nr:hypothetical protein SVAN01_09727 [Stagonosporopsis vannaccii]